LVKQNLPVYIQLKLLQIIYSGLGGHSSVGFSLIDADLAGKYTHSIIFYGIEEVPEAFEAKCNELGIDYFIVRKVTGLDIGSQKQVVSLLKKIKPDIILLHANSLIIPAYYYRMLHKTKLITVEHQSNELKTIKEWILSLLIITLSGKVVYLTDLYKEQVKQKLGFIFKTSKSKVINNGINAAIFKPLLKTGEIEKAQNKAIGMLSRLSENKDHLVLLEAFRLLLIKNENRYQIKLLLAGEGITKANLVKQAARLNLQDTVVFCGLLSERESAIFINEIDLYVHASFGETMSTAIMQAMACKKPVIASNVTGINNMLIDAETAMLVPVSNPEALAGAMWELLNNGELADQLANNAYQFANKHFTNIVMFSQYDLLFNT
jgi:glycosyltransferase involved in cell wall biosynthesis